MEQQEPAGEDMAEEKDKQEREEVKDKNRKENAESGEMSLFKLRQFLAKVEELKDFLMDSNPKGDRIFDFVNSMSSLLAQCSALYRKLFNIHQQKVLTQYFRRT